MHSLYSCCDILHLRCFQRGVKFYFCLTKTHLYIASTRFCSLFIASVVTFFFFFSGYSTTFTAHFSIQNGKKQRERHLACLFLRKKTQIQSAIVHKSRRSIKIPARHKRLHFPSRRRPRERRGSWPIYAICVNSVNVHFTGNVCICTQSPPPPLPSPSRIFIQQIFLVERNLTLASHPPQCVPARACQLVCACVCVCARASKAQYFYFFSE